MSDYLKLKQAISKTDVWIVAFCCLLIIPFFYNTFANYYHKNGLIRFIFFALFQYINPLILVYFIVYIMLPVFVKNRNIFVFILTLLIFLIAQGILTRYMYSLIAGRQLNVNYNTITTEMQFIIILAAPLSMILFIKQLIATQNQLLTTEKEKKEAELKLLKQQIDPHFLFNNLNILGVLIQQDKAIAGEYLNRFASLYRYIIKHKDEDVVLLDDEWIFAQDYIFLIQQRFGNAYIFEEFSTLPPSRFVPPGAIQTLIENIIKHNQGDKTQPLAITIEFTDQYCCIKNKISPKLTSVESTKTGLKNLATRYKLLSDQKMIVRQTESNFEVQIPLLKTV
jgi:sensor histidine kinase YesM